jgi:hypothetical protein
MRLLIFSLLLLTTGVSYSQELYTYTDSLNQFQIGIPFGWLFGKDKDHARLLLMSRRPKIDSEEKFVENFNVTIVRERNINLDTAFSHLLKYNSMADSFLILEKGSTVIDGQDFRWVVSTHINKYATQKMYNYDFMIYYGGKAYLLTMGSTPDHFEKYRGLFEKIAKTFKVNNFK